MEIPGRPLEGDQGLEEPFPESVGTQAHSPNRITPLVQNLIDLRPLYRSAYYAGGYPPESEGVCTDLVWRAFEHAGFDLKSMVDHDIASAVKEYPRVENQPDPNIDFRRVPNLYAFFKRHAITLTNEVKPWDLENLKQWQPGDIVILGRNPDHIGIVSDMRFRNGVPKILHHGSKYPSQDNPWGTGPGAFEPISG